MLVNEVNDASQADSQILHPSTRVLFRFWEAARAEQAAPARNKFDLRQIGHLVPNLMILERNPRTRGFRWRLAGTGVCDLYRREVTGTDIHGGWECFEADVINRLLAGVIELLQPCLLRFRLHTDLGQIVGAELIGLPLQANDGQGMQIFGGVFPFRETASLGYHRIDRMELAGARSIWTEHLPGDALVRQLDRTGQGPFRPFQVIPGGRNGAPGGRNGAPGGRKQQP